MTYSALDVANEAFQIIEDAYNSDMPTYQLRKPMRELRERVKQAELPVVMPRYIYNGEQETVLVGVGTIKPGQSFRVPNHIAEHIAEHPLFSLHQLKVSNNKTLRVICPYTNLKDETKKALKRYAPQVEFVDVSGSESALWEMWHELWKDCRDTLVVEHDIVIHEDVVASLSACGELWCTYGYPYAFGTGNPYHGTGCVRFRGELMAEFPDLWDLVGKMSGPHHPQKHWCSLDGYSQVTLWAAEYHSHQHDPACKHLDPGNSHGCLGQF
jgi:hypothetical protein